MRIYFYTCQRFRTTNFINCILDSPTRPMKSQERLMAPSVEFYDLQVRNNGCRRRLIRRDHSVNGRVSCAASCPAAKNAAAIIGAGVSGLSCAVLLARAGANVTVIESPSAKMVSPVACALWLPTWVSGNDELLGSTAEVQSLAEDSWFAYSAILSSFGQAAGLRSYREPRVS